MECFRTARLSLLIAVIGREPGRCFGNKSAINFYWTSNVDIFGNDSRESVQWTAVIFRIFC